MKRLLKRLLTQGQYDALGKLRNKTLPDIRYRLGQSPFLLIGSIIKILPDNSLITLKSGINIVKKMDYQQRNIYLNIESDFEYRVRLHSSKKEPDTIEWIESFLKDGDVLFDIGANDGVYSLVASKLFDGKITVYAFEPAYLNFSQLCKNLLLNECEGKVIPLQIALSDKTGISEFNYRNLTPGGAVHALGDAVDADGGRFTPVSKQPVMAYRVDDLIEQFQLPMPNHIKIDVDGTEFSVLKGMKSTLHNASIRSMLIELNGTQGQPDQVLEYLAETGFELHSKYGLNHLLVRPE